VTSRALPVTFRLDAPSTGNVSPRQPWTFAAAFALMGCNGPAVPPPAAGSPASPSATPAPPSSVIAAAARDPLAEPSASALAPPEPAAPGHAGHAGHRGHAPPSTSATAAASAPAAPKAPKGGATVHTCPMHPEVRQAGPGRCPHCGMNLEPKR
jgi:hypothetical protein